LLGAAVATYTAARDTPAAVRVLYCSPPPSGPAAAAALVTASRDRAAALALARAREASASASASACSSSAAAAKAAADAYFAAGSPAQAARVARECLEEQEEQDQEEEHCEALRRALLDGALAGAATGASDAAELFEARATRLFAALNNSSSQASAASAARSAAEAAAALWRRAGRPGRALRLALALPPRAGLVLLAEGLAHEVARDLIDIGGNSDDDDQSKLERRWSVGACVRALAAAAPDGEQGAALRLCRALAAEGAYEAALDAVEAEALDLTDELAEALTPPKPPASTSQQQQHQRQRAATLARLASLAGRQRRWPVAAKKHAQSGDRAAALSCLLRSGDDARVAAFALAARRPHLCVEAAGALRARLAADWGQPGAPALHRNVSQLLRRAAPSSGGIVGEGADDAGAPDWPALASFYEESAAAEARVLRRPAVVVAAALREAEKAAAAAAAAAAAGLPEDARANLERLRRLLSDVEALAKTTEEGGEEQQARLERLFSAVAAAAGTTTTAPAAKKTKSKRADK
jgi:hypothetical protein